MKMVITQYLDDHHIELLSWPVFSPDLNPIEHAWDELDRHIRLRPVVPRTAQEPAADLKEEWRVLPQVTLRRLIQSMHGASKHASQQREVIHRTNLL
uniref:Tc1-like transposase DDE domain-containing protein n=1 Tax=Eptatretus burgeri TaxID=7764 RepID=A0A8C4QWJ9_EPTBU